MKIKTKKDFILILFFITFLWMNSASAVVSAKDQASEFTVQKIQTRNFSGVYVTQTKSGQISRVGPNSIKFDQRINGKRHVGTLYFQSSSLNKSNWTYTWNYAGNVSPK